MRRPFTLQSGFAIPVLCAFVFLLTGCYRMRTSHGGGQIKQRVAREMNPADVLVHPGYRIELVAQGLTFPTALTFDDNGSLYVVEAGYSYGEVWEEPRLSRIEDDGSKTIIARGKRNGPWNGVTFFDKDFYVSEGGEADGGKILRISREGDVRVLADGLPAVGDHHTNGPVIKDGYLYFGQGTATNSAVVGEDNANFGWLKRKKEFHDIPCKDLVLTGVNYSSTDALSGDKSKKVLTGAFSAFGTSTSAGQVIKGRVPCTGAILRVPVGGGDVEMVSWGLRNPFGLALSPEGKLFTTENGFDERGSRPVWGAGDVLWEVQRGKWYGWPDFAGGKSIVNNEEFTPPSGKPLKAVLQTYPEHPPKPVAVFGVHSSACGFDFSHSDDFGFTGEAFVAEFGDMAPGVGKVLAPVGFKVVRVNIESGVIRDFVVNKGKRNGPASLLRSGGLERPVSVKFDPAGTSLYIVDFGILKTTKKGSEPAPNTGVIWKVTRK